MHILIAPNAFKNALDATHAARAMARGLRQSRLKCACECFPIADGGDGTANLLVQHCGGKVHSAKVRDPLGRKITAKFGTMDRRKTAVIELANASGLRLLRQNEFNPLRATTFGTGELIRRALDRGARKIILGVGGSATVDGGVGILQALGVRFQNARGEILSHLPENLVRLRSIDLSQLDKRILGCELVIPCDVENPLLGPVGAAKVFGPQKGAMVSDVRKLEAGLKTFAEVIFRQTGKDVASLKHGGAAGGVPAGLNGLLGAKLVNGIRHFLDFTDFDAALRRADLVITGEGQIDEQTLHGKGPFGVALRAKRKKLPVIGLAGKVQARTNSPLWNYFDELVPISDGKLKLETALRLTKENLQLAARRLGDQLHGSGAAGIHAR